MSRTLNFEKYLKLPRINSGYKVVWLRNYLHFKKNYLVNFLWIFFEPTVLFLGLGYGLGNFINNIDGFAYVDYLFPGFLCTASMMVSFLEGTYNTFSKLHFQNIYKNILLTRIDTYEISFGELLWSTFKGFLSALCLSLVALTLGLIQNINFLQVLAVVFINSWSFSCLALIFTAKAKDYNFFIYSINGLLIPLVFISGVYFPIKSLPFILQIFSYLSPLFHSVSLCRQILSNSFSLLSIFHLIYLFLLSYFSFTVSIKYMQKKLLN